MHERRIVPFCLPMFNHFSTYRRYENVLIAIATIAVLSFISGGCSTPTTMHSTAEPDSLHQQVTVDNNHIQKPESIDSSWASRQMIYDSSSQRLSSRKVMAPLLDSLQKAEYHTFILSFERHGLVDVQKLDSNLMVALAYATPHNFVGIPLYPSGFNTAYLQPSAAEKLKNAHEILIREHPNWRMIIFDAARPQSVQFKMWKKVVGTAQQSYVAEPYWGSMHNFGCSIDIGLYDIKGDSLLNMGTAFDNFTNLAQPRHENRYLRSGHLTAQQHEHRLALRNAMLNAGFRMVNHEWWHFEAFSVDYIRKNYKIIP
jgi:zinc D-Ala-D-Ala dipeptidase